MDVSSLTVPPSLMSRRTAKLQIGLNMKISTAKRHVTLARKALREDANPENQKRFDEAISVLAKMQIAEDNQLEAPSAEITVDLPKPNIDMPGPTTDDTIEDTLADGKDAVIIKLVQVHNLSLAKAAVTYRAYATAHDLDDNKNSMSHQLIEWFTSNSDATSDEITKKGEEIGLSKSSVSYYKTMLTVARDVAARL